MKSLLLSGLILMSLTVEAHDKDRDDHQKHHGEKGKHHEKHQEFEVVPLNSPVKEANAKFRLSIPSGQDVKSVFYKIEGSSKIKDQLLLKKAEIALMAGNQIEIPVSRFAPGKYEVKVWVKLKKGDERSCQHKKKDEVPFVIDSSLEVADPGEAGMKTLLGIDSDGDGIRDDVQRWINENFTILNQKNALKQSAKYRQQGISASDNKQASIEFTKKVLDASGCLDHVMGDNLKEASILEKKLEAEYYNTKERLLAEEKSDMNFSGATRAVYDPLRIPDSQKCEFNLQ